MTRAPSGAPERFLLLALAVLLLPGCAATAGAAKSGFAGTDAWTAAAPGKPWSAAAGLEPAGRRTWTAADPGGSRAMLRAGYAGVVPAGPRQAIDELLGLEQAAMRQEIDGKPGYERGPFAADSMAGTPGGLRWHGFRVDVTADRLAGTSWRWVALHPRFPAVRRAFTLAYDESAPRGTAPVSRLAAARALAASIAPAGRGLAGPIDHAWLDARAAAFAARIDSAQRVCWTNPSGREAIGYGRGLAIDGDFYVVSEVVPRDSLVDPAAAEYGVGFDRNADGRLDLLVVNRGIQPFAGKVLEPTVAIYADDDFDGRVDGLVVEDADRDGDRNVDARLLVRDPDEDGRADEVLPFTVAAAPADGGRERVALDAGRARVRRLGLPGDVSEFGETFRLASTRLVDLDRARAACPPR